MSYIIPLIAIALLAIALVKLHLLTSLATDMERRLIALENADRRRLLQSGIGIEDARISQPIYGPYFQRNRKWKDQRQVDMW